MLEITKRETVFEGKYVRIVNKYFHDPVSGKKGFWEVVQRRCLYKRIVVIFALTENKEVILEKNYRLTLECPVIELPAGLTDKPEETEEDAARRELLEETGYQAEKMIPIFSSTASPGLTSAEFVYFFCPKAVFKGRPEPEFGEQIEVFTVPLAELPDYVLNVSQNSPDGCKVDEKILCLLPLLHKLGHI